MKKCKSGYYYCYTDKKCKPIPRGYHVGGRGLLEPDDDSKKSNGKNGNGSNGSNGNGSNGGNGNGSGNGGNGGGNGGGMSEGKSHKDHEPEMIRNQLKTAGRASKRIEKHSRKKDNFKAWVQSKITKASDYLDTAADYLDSKDVKEGSLHKWFKGSKSKDGKGGWVNVVTGGTCASDEPGEGTPKCVSSAKRASMTKAERLSAARRKKKADPNQQSKSGAAKPTYVSTDSPRKKKMKKESSDWRNEIELTEADKKGKGSGTKDACYHKVKSRYSVWPSAYASGALVKCRKVGAANWGNSTKKEEFEPSGISFQQFSEKCWKGYEKKGMKTMFGKRYPNCVKKEQVERDEYGDPMGGPKISDKQKKKNLAKNEPDKQHTTDTSEGMAYGITRGSGKPSGQMAAFGKEKKKENPYSLKNKLKMVIKSVAEKERAKAGVTKEGVIPEAKYEAGASTYGKATIRNKRKFGTPGEMPDIMTGKKITKDATRGELIAKRREEHKAKRGVKEEVGVSTSTMMDKAKKEAMLRKKEQDAVAKKMKKEESELLVQDWKKDNIKFTEIETVDIIKPEPLNPSDWRSELSEDDMKGMSVKSGHKRPTKSGAGMTQKGVEAYRRRNPGSKLKTAVTTEPSKLKKGSKDANRRKSYCARSAGQMKKFPKAAKDPNSRLRQARRRWNC